MFWLAYLNSAFESGIKSPLDDAILAHRRLDVAAWHKIDEVPFDFERRRVSVLVDDGPTRLLVVKGAPEDVIALSVAYADADGAAPAARRGSTRRTCRKFEGWAKRASACWRWPTASMPPHDDDAIVGDETG